MSDGRFSSNAATPPSGVIQRSGTRAGMPGRQPGIPATAVLESTSWRAWLASRARTSARLASVSSGGVPASSHGGGGAVASNNQSRRAVSQAVI